MTIEEKIDALLNVTRRYGGGIVSPTLQIKTAGRFIYKVSLFVEWPDHSTNRYYGYDYRQKDDELPIISLEQAIDTIYTKVKKDLNEKALEYQAAANELITVNKNLDVDLAGKELVWKTSSTNS